MPTTDGTPCPRCGAPVFMARTTQGSTIPFDAEPTTIYAMDAAGIMRNAGKGHRVHFGTCTNPAPPPRPKTSGTNQPIADVFPDTIQITPADIPKGF